MSEAIARRCGQPVRLLIAALALGLLTASGSSGEEARKDVLPHVESTLVDTTGFVRARQSAFQLWEYGYLGHPNDLKSYKGLDPKIRFAMHRVLEVWETSPDLRSTQSLRLRTGYEWKTGHPQGRPTRSHAIAWLQQPKQLWLFTCESVQKRAEIRAYLVDLKADLAPGTTMGRFQDCARADWPQQAQPTWKHTCVVTRGATEYDHMTAVVDGPGRILIALRSRSSPIRWVSFRPEVRYPAKRWHVGMELW